MDYRTDEPEPGQAPAPEPPPAEVPPPGAPGAPASGVNWRGVVISALGIAFAANMLASYEWGWRVTPSQALANEPRVGLSKRSEGRYLVVRGELSGMVAAGGGRGGHYAVLRDPPGGPPSEAAIGAYLPEGLELRGDLAGRIVRMPPGAAAGLKLPPGAPCLVVGSGRFRSWHSWLAVIIVAWGLVILRRSTRTAAA